MYETEHTYMRCNMEKKVIETLAYAGYEWSWKNDQRYYSEMIPSNSTFGLKVPQLKMVCWFDPFTIA